MENLPFYVEPAVTSEPIVKVGSLSEVLGRRVKLLRLALGLTQKDLSQKHGRIERAYLCRVERTVKKFSISYLERVSEAFGLSVREFLYCDFERLLDELDIELIKAKRTLSPAVMEVVVKLIKERSSAQKFSSSS